jgi:NitT/TauT family transport system ATP-binding protein
MESVIPLAGGRPISLNPKLAIEGLCVDYEVGGGWMRALEQVSLSVAPGEFVSITGPSGCGKSTLLMAVDGLIPTAAGRILVDGTRIDSPGPERAVVFQDASLLPWRTALKNVLLGYELQARKSGGRRKLSSDAEERGKELLRLVGLGGFFDAYPAQLSGGMQQRVNIARALAVEPELILLDEPFAALDAQTREVMQDEIMRIWQAEQVTSVLVTHQIDEAVYLSDRVIVLSARPGRVLADLRVPYDRPRDPSIRQEKPFVDMCRQVWSLIRGSGTMADASRATADVPLGAVGYSEGSR